MNKSIVSAWGMILLAAVFCSIQPENVSAAAKKTVYVISSITVRNTSGRTVDTIKYKYNKRGMASNRTWTQPGGSVTEKYSYDKDLQLKKHTVYGDGGRITSVTTYKYKDGMLTSAHESDKYDNAQDERDFRYEYDKKGRLKFSNGDNFPETTFKYNKKGLLIGKSELSNYPGAEPQKAKYKYDAKGNVTKHYEYGGLFRKYKNKYSGKRIVKVTACYKSGKTICTETIKYRKLKVKKADAKKIAAQQVQYFRDPVFGMFPY